MSIICKLLIIIGVFLVTACDSESEHVSSRELNPVDLDYPIVNTAPNQIVKFNAIIPNGYSKKFRLHYLVDSKQDYPNNKIFVSPQGCSWTNNNQFSINRDLELKLESGNLYTATFVMDYFLPGKCKWHLDSMSSPMFKGKIFYYGQSGHSNSRPFADLNLEENNIHIWCTEKYRRNKKLEPNPRLNERVDCTTLSFVELFVDKPLGFYESIPVDEKEWDIHVTQYLKTLTVVFHDLD